jgi:large subunit ribosomal protein L21
MYAIIKTGGKQYRVQQGESLLIERLPDDDGATVTLQPLLYVDGAEVVDGADLAKVTVEGKILAHERGPKLRIVKFKPKRGYKRRNGHRQDLTRIEITSLKLAARAGSKAATAAKADKPAAEQPVAATSDQPANVEATDGA